MRGRLGREGEALSGGKWGDWRRDDVRRGMFKGRPESSLDSSCSTKISLFSDAATTPVAKASGTTCGGSLARPGFAGSEYLVRGWTSLRWVAVEVLLVEVQPHSCAWGASNSDEKTRRELAIGIGESGG